MLLAMSMELDPEILAQAAAPSAFHVDMGELVGDVAAALGCDSVELTIGVRPVGDGAIEVTNADAREWVDAQIVIEAVERGEVDILVGTQILAKGYHFPNLTLVGVVDADLSLYGGDVRASEKTFQLLHQVAAQEARAAGDEVEGHGLSVRPGAADDRRSPCRRWGCRSAAAPSARCRAGCCGPTR